MAYSGLHANAVSLSSGVQQKFSGAQTQIFAHARDIASLKSTNDMLEAQSTSLVAQMTGIGDTLKLLINQVALTSQLVADS